MFKSYGYVLALTLSALSLSATGANAQNVAQSCLDGEGAAKVRACSEAINLAGFDASDRSLLFSERGDGYATLRDDRQAMADYEQAIALDANQPWPLIGRGNLYAKYRRFEQARADFLRARSLLQARSGVAPGADVTPYIEGLSRGLDYVDAQDEVEAHWLSYLAAIQAERDYPNWSGPPRDIYERAARSIQITFEPAPDPSGQRDIVVTGARLEQARDFVDRLAIASPQENQLARWNDGLCVSVAGLSPRQGQMIVDRIAANAASLGLDPARSGCVSNVFIYFAADAGGLARQMLETRRGELAYYQEENVLTLGRAALEDFAATSRPVRWWHVARRVSDRGTSLSSQSAGSAAPPPPRESEAPGADGITNAPATRSQGTRLRTTTRQDFARVIVIVDGHRAAAAPVPALADYLSMVVLAQVDPAVDASAYPSILNLFSAQRSNAPSGLTDWDRRYLDGLYHATRSARGQQQADEISRRIAASQVRR